MSIAPGPETPEVVSIPIGRWAVAGSPTQLRTLLGSCAGVVLFDRVAKVGGVAHIVLPSSNGSTDHPGKYADTAIPGMIADLDRIRGRAGRNRLVAKIVGGASMFQAGPAMDIGRRNSEAVEQILAGLGIPVLARDVGGETGRRLTFDTSSGTVSIRVPGGEGYDI